MNPVRTPQRTLATPPSRTPWSDLLRVSVDFARQPEFRTDDEALRLQGLRRDGADAPFVFVHMLTPFARAGRRALRGRIGDCGDVLSRAAETDLDTALLNRLSTIATPSLYQAFDAARRDEGQGYEAFVSTHLDDGYARLFATWPVLARLLATATVQWVDATAEFVENLRVNRARLTALLTDPADAARAVARLGAGLSDPHHGGRSVFAVTFASGQTLYYKPRSLAIEDSFGGLLRWINARSDLPELATLKVLDLGTHGWMEAAEHAAVTDQAAADRFFTRAGMLLCLVHTLRGTDLHNENLVACGEHPVLVDLEMLPNHRGDESPASGDGEAQARAMSLMSDSVLRTGLLPFVGVGVDENVARSAGLGPPPLDAPQLEMRRLVAINTDDMRREKQRVSMDVGAHRVLIGDEPCSLSDHLQPLLTGLRSMHRFLREHRAGLLDENGPLRRLLEQRVRIVIRPTRAYAALLGAAMEPEWLGSGGARRAFLEKCLRVETAMGKLENSPTLLEAERAALEALDVPYFTADADGRALNLPDGARVGDWFAASGAGWVEQTLRDLDDADEEFQSEVVRMAILSGNTEVAVAPVREARPDADLTDDELLVEAVRIGDEIASRAIRGEDGTATWLTFGFVPGAGYFAPQMTGGDLYDGAGGIALLFASLAQATGFPRFRVSAYEALESLRVGIDRVEGGDAIPSDTPLGAATGLGSLVYVLIAAHDLLGDDELLRDAQRAARLLTAERFAADEALDLHCGTAGALQALLVLHDVESRTGHSRTDTLARAVAAGERLLSRRVASPSGHRTWRSMGELLAGMSHGAAGIAMPLLRLADASGRSDFEAAAREAIAFERSVFDPARGNWPDFRKGDDGSDRRFMTAWCHGAPGIGLARIAGLAYMDDEATREEIAIAAGTTAASAPCANDHLCCGMLGRTELLHQASRALGQPDLAAAAVRFASSVVRAAHDANGCYRLHGDHGHGVSIPGAFLGLAGVGLQLLRLAGAGRPPAITTFTLGSELEAGR